MWIVGISFCGTVNSDGAVMVGSHSSNGLGQFWQLLNQKNILQPTNSSCVLDESLFENRMLGAIESPRDGVDFLPSAG